MCHYKLFVLLPKRSAVPLCCVYYLARVTKAVLWPRDKGTMPLLKAVLLGDSTLASRHSSSSSLALTGCPLAERDCKKAAIEGKKELSPGEQSGQRRMCKQIAAYEEYMHTNCMHRHTKKHSARPPSPQFLSLSCEALQNLLHRSVRSE